MRVVTVILSFSMFLSAYADPVFFTDPSKPMKVDNSHTAELNPSSTNPLRVVSLNLHFSMDIEGAIKYLQNTEGLKNVDILFLQEVSADNLDKGWNAARQIASALGMNYFYSPAMIKPQTKKYYGNAILSRWPLREPERIVLPHKKLFPSKERRVAIGATIELFSRPVRLYSVHLENFFDLGSITSEYEDKRKDQVQTILDAAEQRRVDKIIVGGDFNIWRPGSYNLLVRQFLNHHFTFDLPNATNTFSFVGNWIQAQLDLIFSKGLKKLKSNAAPFCKCSDHKAVWADYDIESIRS